MAKTTAANFPPLLRGMKHYFANCTLLEQFVYDIVRSSAEEDVSEAVQSECLLWFVLLQFFKFKGKHFSRRFRELIAKAVYTGVLSFGPENVVNKVQIFNDFSKEDMSRVLLKPETTHSLANVEAALVKGDKKGAISSSLKQNMWGLGLVISRGISPVVMDNLMLQYTMEVLPENSIIRNISILNANKKIDVGNLSLDTVRRIIVASLLADSRNWYKQLAHLGDKLRDHSNNTHLSHTCYVLSSVPFNTSSRRNFFLLGSLKSSKDYFTPVDDMDSLLRTEIYIQACLLRAHGIDSKLELSSNLSDTGSAESRLSVSFSSAGTVNGTHTGRKMGDMIKSRMARQMAKKRTFALYQFQRFGLIQALAEDRKNSLLLEYLVDVAESSTFIVPEAFAGLHISDMDVRKGLITSYKTLFNLLEEKAPDAFEEFKAHNAFSLLFGDKQEEVEFDYTEKSEDTLMFKSEDQENVNEDFFAQQNDPQSPISPVKEKQIKTRQPPNNQSLPLSPLKQQSIPAPTPVQPNPPASESVAQDPFARNNKPRQPGIPIKRTRRKSVSKMRHHITEANKPSSTMQALPVMPPPPRKSQSFTEGVQPKPIPATSESGAKKKAPVGGNTFLARMRNKLLHNLVPVSGTAVKVDDGIGQELEAYYDNDLKRWVFPGQDVAANTEPAAPNMPPTAPVTNNVSKPKKLKHMGGRAYINSADLMK